MRPKSSKLVNVKSSSVTFEQPLTSHSFLCFILLSLSLFLLGLQVLPRTFSAVIIYIIVSIIIGSKISFLYKKVSFASSSSFTFSYLVSNP
ncbi:hypothetical protein CLU79DRAFT_770622 [Phycomyces nitens]|nr:hypothetical protein CLU79DRAFT_770622 [Phycomyces nitens]